ncbi:hypothetical protein A2U01_0059475 [Trifolium medium]|uniref:Uncharacterized protein n=1 Tax=Trifolium medium TaxID=97028 RepID=A0A392RPW2_9FABA|nr:hypothetical protein [Trifolium medium]
MEEKEEYDGGDEYDGEDGQRRWRWRTEKSSMEEMEDQE